MYRLLNPGEKVLTTDEFWEEDERVWRTVVGTSALGRHVMSNWGPIRRQERSNREYLINAIYRLAVTRHWNEQPWARDWEHWKKCLDGAKNGREFERKLLDFLEWLTANAGDKQTTLIQVLKALYDESEL